MSNINKRSHNVGLVPVWLADKVTEGRVPVDALVSYEKLSSIISPQDVCFYHEYLTRTHHYTEGVFDDMCTIASLPENTAWIAMNAVAAKSAADQFAYSFQKHQDDLGNTAVPITVRFFSYVPVAVDTHSLILLCTRGEPLSRNESSKRCIEELNKQMPFDQYKQFNVFRVYCQ